MGTQSRYAVSIVANDKTAAGVGSALKRMKDLPKAANDAGKAGEKFDRAMDRAGRRSVFGLRNIVRTFGAVEQAASRALGTGSLTGGLVDRLGAIESASGAAATGLGTASAEAGIFGSAIGAAGVTVAATVAVVAALGYAAYKLADGWSAAGAAVGRTSRIIGIASKDLQELQGAAERYGIEKGTTDSSLNSFAQNVNNARYGRDPGLAGLLSALGISNKYDATGNIDVSAMLADTADALKRQKNPQTAAAIASRLGVGGLLPMLLEGGGNLKSEMADVGAHGVELTPGEIERATRFQRKKTMTVQLFQRGKAAVGAVAVSGGEPVLDAALGAGQSLADKGLGGVARKLSPAVDKLDRAAGELLRAAGRFLGMGASGDLASRIEHRGERSRQDQVSPKGARGVMQVMPATAAQIARENGFRLDRQKFRDDPEYSRMLGRLYLDKLARLYPGHEEMQAAGYNAGPGAVDKWAKKYGDPRKGEITPEEWSKLIPYKETRDYVQRVTGGHASAGKIEIEFKGLPAGTTAKEKHSDGRVKLHKAMAE